MKQKKLNDRLEDYMTTQILEWMKRMSETYIPKYAEILEIGGMDMNGSVRQFFPKAQYTSTDMMEGKGVDLVINAHDLPSRYAPESFDMVICLETLEHDDRFWQTLEIMRALVRPGGLLAISTPTFKFPLHRHPKDYWRFGEDAYREVLFDGYEILDLQEVISKGVNPGIVCLGRKPL